MTNEWAVVVITMTRIMVYNNVVVFVVIRSLNSAKKIKK